MSSCVVCFEKFNKSIRAKTECSYCNTAICRGCLQMYLLNDITDTPKCVNTVCEARWTRDFLDTQLTATFRFNDYKKHRERILCDREKSRLPATQEDALAYKAARTKEPPVKQQMDWQRFWQLTAEYRVHQQALRSFGRIRPNGDAAAVIQRAAFIRTCPAEGCRGFLSTAWKCGMCEKYTCKDCHELKGARQNANHTCHPDNVASAAAIIADTKPCPKCGIRIWKIEGCDQMWCTGCNTGFSWNTGQIATGIIHNPHYFEWRRRNNPDAGNNAFNGGGPGFVCERNDDIRIHHILGTDNPRSIKAWLTEAWRILREEQTHRAPRITEEEAYRILRVRYLAEEINEEEWKQKTQQAEKKYRSIRAVQQIRDTMVAGGQDILRQLLQPAQNMNTTKKQLTDLVDFCNKSYETVGKQFNHKVESYMINIDDMHARNIKRFDDRQASTVNLIKHDINTIMSMMDALIEETKSTKNEKNARNTANTVRRIISSIENTERLIKAYIREEEAVKAEIAADAAAAAAITS